MHPRTFALFALTSFSSPALAQSAVSTQGCLELTNGALRRADDPSLDLSGPMTIEAWVRPTAFGGTVVEKWYDTGSGQRSYSLALTPQGHVRFRIARSDNQSDALAHEFTAGTLDLGRWQHIACTYDGVERRIYVDGLLEGSLATSGPIHAGSADLLVGAHLGDALAAPVDHVSGRVDELRIWSSARSQQQLRATMGVAVGAHDQSNLPGRVASMSFNENGLDLVSGISAAPGAGVSYVVSDWSTALDCAVHPQTLLHLRFEESAAGQVASGTNSLYSFGGSQVATPEGGPTYVSGMDADAARLFGTVSEHGLELDGVDDAFRVDAPFVMNALSDATIEFSMKILAYGGHSVIWGREADGVDSNYFQLYFAGTVPERLGFNYREPSDALHQIFDPLDPSSTGGMSLVLDTWYHIAIVRKSVEAGWEYRLFLDGSLVTSTIHNDTNWPTGASWWFARRSPPGTSFPTPHVRVDELRATAAALEPAQFLIAPTQPDLNTNGIVDCDECLAHSFCDTTPNSVGAGAHLRADGIPSLSRDLFDIVATGCPPHRRGIFLYSDAAGSAPMANGTLCMSAPFRRLTTMTTSVFGVATLPFEMDRLLAGSVIQPGDTWRFQFWYRDPAAGGSLANLSDGLTVRFCP